MRVVFATRELIARCNATVTVARAGGVAGAIGQRALRTAAVVALSAAAEAAAYGNVSSAAHVAPAELTQYIWWDQAMTLVGAGGQLQAPLRTANVADRVTGELLPQLRSGWSRRRSSTSRRTTGSGIKAARMMGE